MKSRNIFLIGFLIIASLFTTCAISSPREDAIKSGFLYNFARYSQGEWFNPETNTRYTICSFSEQFTDAATQTLEKLTIKNHRIVIKHLTTKRENISDCDTLYISKNDIHKWHDLNDSKMITHAMLVGEYDGFLDAGGHINFYIVGGKVRFEANPVKLKNAGINMSSKVLRLGRVYKGDQE